MAENVSMLSGLVQSAQANFNDSRVARTLGTRFMVDRNEWEPQRTNNFELVVEGLNSITLASGGPPVTFGNAGDRIMLSVDQFTAPSLEISRITTHYANNSIKWAGKPDFPDSSITVNDYIGVQVEQILSAWFRAAYDFETEAIGLAVNYKKAAHLIEYDPQGGTPRIWKMEGCWLANLNLGEWSQEGGQQRKIQATFIYDRVYPVTLQSPSDASFSKQSNGVYSSYTAGTPASRYAFQSGSTTGETETE